eukprot:TRINITY_DN690_c0_g1_i2.p1 TRINITY_DN690_c0_g1~~TRINITY_DN690_c0_g1_i2.p1  ORF type:complete len:430 (+),score=129.53 TRINITY_DN690_c0_g1_i2:58-1347(+)
MSKLCKVVAVAAVAGSVVWVGHQVVRHHQKAARLHTEIAEFVGEVHERHQNENVAVQDFADFKQEDGRRQRWSHSAADDTDSLAQGGDDWRFGGDDGRKGGAVAHEEWGRRWRRHHERDNEEEQHSDSGDEHGEERRSGRRHRRGCGKSVQGSSTDDHERQTWANARQKWHESVKAKSFEVTDVESAVVTSVNLAKIAAPAVVVGGLYGGAEIVQDGNKLTGQFLNSPRPAFSGEMTSDTTGYVNFPDDRTYSFEFDANSRTMYWDGRNSGNVWKQTQAQDASDKAVQQPVVDEVPELEDNHDEDPQEQEAGNEFPADDANDDVGSAGSRRHHARRFRDEEHNRSVESSLTEEERAELRRLRKEARRLHCDAARTAGGFVAGAAFVGGVAHLRRLRRERRQAAAAASSGACNGGVCSGQSNALPSVTNA